MKKNGRIYSIETLGALDGPGIRTVIFLQGCPLGCAYCHNPDSWDLKGGTEYGIVELMQKIKRYIPYYKEHGGVTISGGEPLVQASFATEILKACKEYGINTSLDTSAAFFNGQIKELLRYTDLVIADAKGLDEKSFKENCGGSFKTWQKFMEYCEKIGKRMWLRYVIIAGQNDSPDDVLRLADLAERYDNIEKIELLPYHHEGALKWHMLGRNYTLQTKQIPTDERMSYLRTLLQKT